MNAQRFRIPLYENFVPTGKSGVPGQRAHVSTSPARHNVTFIDLLELGGEEGVGTLDDIRHGQIDASDFIL